MHISRGNIWPVIVLVTAMAPYMAGVLDHSGNKKMRRIKEELLATDLAVWRKKGVFLTLLFLSAFQFYIVYVSSGPKLLPGLWSLRHFLGMAALQSIAQISLGFYLLNNKIPNYVIYSVLITALFSQLMFGLAVILVSNA